MQLANTTSIMRSLKTVLARIRMASFRIGLRGEKMNRDLEVENLETRGELLPELRRFKNIEKF